MVFLKFREKSWYMTIKKVVSIMLAMILLLSACSHATLDLAGTELEDAVANLFRWSRAAIERIILT